MIECTTLYNKKKLVPKKSLMFRPAAYAVITNDCKVLLVNTRSTGKLFLPGGGVDLGESVEEALRREIKEEVGIKIEVVRFLKFKESFFYYDPLDEAYQNLSFFFFCKPKTFDLLNNDKIEDGEAFDPQWINIKDLKKENFQVFGKEIMEFFNEYN